jgi:protein-disulfide isomerase-like protein with CxxC motif
MQLIYVADPMCSWCYGFAARAPGGGAGMMPQAQSPVSRESAKPSAETTT